MKGFCRNFVLILTFSFYEYYTEALCAAFYKRNVTLKPVAGEQLDLCEFGENFGGRAARTRRLQQNGAHKSCRRLALGVPSHIFLELAQMSLLADYEATTSCKNVKNTSTKKQPFMLQIAACHRSVRYNNDLPLPPIQSCSSTFSAWSCIASNFDKGRWGITSIRLWTSHLCQNTVQCLKYFCNWLQHHGSDRHKSKVQLVDTS